MSNEDLTKGISAVAEQWPLTGPSSRARSPLDTLEHYQSFRQLLCQFSASQALGKPETRKSAKAHKSRERFLLELEPEQLSQLRKRLVAYWPGMRKKSV